jgi:malonate decarboxylase epsilon subunit
VNVESKIAFLFPGQGSQKPGMLARLRQHPAGAELLSEAGNVLAQDPLEFDNAEAQTGTRATQLGLLIAGVASAHLLAAERVMPDFVAGHSVGAFAAAVHAQVLRFADALRLVDLRGRLMAEAYPHGYGMVAISGVPERTLEDWIDAAHAHGATLHFANRNAARQFTVSGADADLAAFLAHARAHGAGKAVRLAIAIPSHSPLMAGVAARMSEAIGEVQLSHARIPFATNRRARMETDSRAIGEDLATGVAHRVLWHEIGCALYERGVRTFVETAPGSVLGGLVQATLDELRAGGVGDEVRVFAFDQTDAAGILDGARGSR